MTESVFSTVVADRIVENVRSVSLREVVELAYEYYFPDISLLPQKNGQSYFTPIFFSKSHPSVKWCLQIYPKGEIENDENHMSIFLDRVLSEEDAPVVALFKITLMRDREEIVSLMGEPQKYSHSKPGYGWGHFISLDKLRGAINNNCRNELKLHCQLVCEVRRSWATSFAKYLSS